MTKREAVRRIKALVADEMRVSISMHPEYLETEPGLVQQLWERTVWDLADRISKEHTHLTPKPLRPGELDNI